MSQRIIILTLLFGLCLATPIEYQHNEEEHNDDAHYEFEYSVHDAHTGDIKEQKESRKGDVVNGVYSLVEPGGHRRTVHYSSDKHGGFQAQVVREGSSHPVAQVHHIAPQISHVSPITFAHHVSPVAVAHHVAPIAVTHHVSHVAPVAHIAHVAPVAHVAHVAPVAHVAFAHHAPVAVAHSIPVHGHVATSHASIQQTHTSSGGYYH